MTKYIIELFHKGERKPYRTFTDTLPHGDHPTDTHSSFGGRLGGFLGPYRAIIRYASNNAEAARTYWDVNGNKKIRWHR